MLELWAPLLTYEPSQKAFVYFSCIMVTMCVSKLIAKIGLIHYIGILRVVHNVYLQITIITTHINVGTQCSIHNIVLEIFVNKITLYPGQNQIVELKHTD